jgi:hypothetical protein
VQDGRHKEEVKVVTNVTTDHPILMRLKRSMMCKEKLKGKDRMPMFQETDAGKNSTKGETDDRWQIKNACAFCQK